MLRISLVSNELPPYRIPFFRTLGRTPVVALQVLFCSRREPNRLWEIPPLDFGHLFLREQMVTIRGRYIHNNPGVIPALHRFSPDVIITGGFNPTHLYAFAYAMARRLPHVVMTDGTDISERGLGKWHRTVRRFVYARSGAFVSASEGGQRLFASYGIPAEACFRSCLCIDNALFAPLPQMPEKRFDFLFCGRIEAVKNPLFALEVALATARKLGRKVSILFVGTGAQEAELKAAAARQPELVDAEFKGFVAHDVLPSLYHSARLFLFPSLWDPWGVVANEACAAGLPVLVSPQPGVAGELVIDGHNGFVSEPDIAVWTEHAVSLLTRHDMWERFSRNSVAMAGEYTYDKAAAGVVAACRFALSRRTAGRYGDVST